MPEPNKHMGIWDSWISLSLHKATTYFLKALCWNCILYMVISVCIAWILSTTNEGVDDDNDSFLFFDSEIQQHQNEMNDGETSKQRHDIFQDAIFKSFWKPLKMVCVILSILGFVHSKLQSCILVRDIRSGRKVRPSFPEIAATTTNNKSVSLLPMVGVRRITNGRGRVEFVNPTRDDILIGTRFDSLYLRIVNRFLDYHTGNRVWRNLIREASVCTERGLFFFTNENIPTIVIDSILRKMKGKMLLQTPETGKFSVMTYGDSRIFTRRALILEHSLLLSELDRSISFMISEMRFESTLRATPIALFAVGVLEGIGERIFGESDLFTNKKDTRRESGSTSSPLLRSVRLLMPVEKYVSILKPEKIKAYKNKRQRGPRRLQLNYIKELTSNRKRMTNSKINGQRILQLNRQNRKR